MKNIRSRVFFAMMIAITAHCADFRDACQNLKEMRENHTLVTDFLLEMEENKNQDLSNKNKEMERQASQYNAVDIGCKMINASSQLLSMGKDIKGFFATQTEEEKKLSANIIKRANEEGARAQQNLEILDAESSFRKCLINNMFNPELGSLGIPIVCEVVAKRYRILGYSDKVDNIIADFQK